MIKKGFQPLKFATWSENPGYWVSSVLNCIQLSFFLGIQMEAMPSKRTQCQQLTKDYGKVLFQYLI